MAVFISVLEGDDPGAAKPILATRDPRVVAAVARAIAQCLGVKETPPRVLALADKRGSTDEGES
jgi:hypothetical protein